MIDTLGLYFNDYEIENSKNLCIDKGKILPQKDGSILDTGLKMLFRDSKNNPVFGAKAFLNTPIFQVDILPALGQGSINLFVKCSIPKVYSGSDCNIKSVGKTGIRPSLIKLEKALRHQGIKCNPQEARLKRLDMFKNIETENPFNDYEAIITELSLIRAKDKEFKHDEKFEGFWSGNKTRQLCVYDKISEQISLGKILDPSLSGKNIARIEYRLMKAKAIQTDLRIEKACQLETNYNDIKNYYNERLLKLFQYEYPVNHEETNQLCKDSIDKNKIVNLFYFCKENKGRNYLKFFFDLMMTDPDLDIDLIINIAMEHAELKNIRDIKSRMKKRYSEMKFFKRAGMNHNRNFLQLYNELKEKILSA